jgi:N6-adenosine-specific RNA methylase IME4
MSKKYQILYADPCWDYKGQTQHAGIKSSNTGGAIKHYETMTLKQLKELKPMIDNIADDDCLLFMWSSSPHLDQAIELMKAWGFQWATVGFVWDKQRVNPSFYSMSQIELCLIGKRKEKTVKGKRIGGKIPQPRGARNVRQFVSEMRGRHSAKPNEVRLRIEQMFPTQNKIELFAREKVAGWDAWGNEIESDI